MSETAKIPCLPSAEDLDFRNFLEQQVVAAEEKLENEGGNPALNDYAGMCADRLLQLASPRFNLDYGQRNALIPFISRALQHDFAIEDLESILTRVADSPLITSDDQFFYTFVQMLSLRIAQKLNSENLFNGGSGISGDFDEFCEYIEDAELVTGELTIQPSSGQALATQASPCFYDPIENVINVAPFNSGFSTNTIINFTAHESYHAFEYHRYREMLTSNVREREYPAYTVGDRVKLLLDGPERIEESIEIFLLQLDKGEFSQEMSNNYMACMQRNDPLQSWAEASSIKSGIARFAWEETQRSALLGITPLKPMGAAFDKFLGMSTLLAQLFVMKSRAMQRMSALANSGAYGQLEAELSERQSNIEPIRGRFLEQVEQTSDRARTGWAYGSALMSLAALAQQLGRQDAYEDAVEIFISDADLIADAMLYMPQ